MRLEYTIIKFHRNVSVKTNSAWLPSLENQSNDTRTYISNREQEALTHISVQQPLKEQPISFDINGVGTCLWIYFVLKIVQEAFQSFAPMFTEEIFGWPDEKVGGLLALIGIVPLPLSLLLGYISYRLNDQKLLINSFFYLGLGVTLTFQFGWFSVSTFMYQYVLGAIVLVAAAQALESACLSSISRIMPKCVSRGLWNSAFLSTEAGSLGRVVGASSITLIGCVSDMMGQLSVSEMQTIIVIISIFLIILSIIFIYWNWNALSSISDKISINIANDADAILASELWKKLPELHPLCVQLNTMTKIPIIPDN